MTDDGVSMGGPPAEPSSGLLERVKVQDQSAWERLVRLYSPLVYRWCRQGGVSATDAADVGQEVFRAVARKVSDFRRDRDGDSFCGWLRVITRSKVCDHLRARREQAAATGGSDALTQLEQLPQPEEASDEGQSPEDTRILYRRAMELIQSEFEETTWQAFYRVVVEGQSPADAAAALGMTASAVYTAKSRVLRRLREEFADLIEM